MKMPTRPETALSGEHLLEALLERRFGRLHTRRRLALEREQEARRSSYSLALFPLEDHSWSPRFMRAALRLMGLYRRGLDNACQVQVRHNRIITCEVPSAFQGFTILQLSDLHIDMNPQAMQRVAELAQGAAYDVCVLTGDFRGKTYGPFEPALAGLARLRQVLKGRVYAVLGNHDPITMVPGIEEMGIRVLLNECEAIERGGARLHLAGIDDPHFYRLHNIEQVAASIPHGEFSILLSHTPEVYRQAAHAGFDVLLCGHTHGGQICLPSGVPLTLGATLPRRLAAGAWRYQQMIGYTSVGAGSSVLPVRFNCPPEITLHRLQRR
jgi:uncharacterized protein